MTVQSSVLAVALGAPLVALGAGAACIPDLPGDSTPQSPARCGDGFVDLDAGEQCDPGSPLGGGGCSASCQMQCDGLVWSENNHCYELAPGTTAVAAKAIDQCSGLANAHVVTFDDEEEFNTVAAYFRGLGVGPFWVGVENGANVAPVPEPGWTARCPGCYAHSLNPSAPLPRYGGRTDGGPPREACVAANPDPRVPTWEQYPCPGQAPALSVICEREPVGRQSRPCAGGICIDLVLTHASKRYVYVPAAVTSQVAEQGCAALGGRLIVLASRLEREQLWLQLSRLDAVPSTFWVGLTQRSGGVTVDGGDAGASSWVWDDGTAAGAYPSEWAINEPVGSAHAAEAPVRAFLWRRGTVFADNTLAHEEVAGSMPMPYVCEVPPTDGGSSR